jgi:hypothetical protein
VTPRMHTAYACSRTLLTISADWATSTCKLCTHQQESCPGIRQQQLCRSSSRQLLRGLRQNALLHK